jgi:hypothetical protein
MFYTRIFKHCENVDKMYAREKFYVNNPKVILSSMAFHTSAFLSPQVREVWFEWFDVTDAVSKIYQLEILILR